MRKRIVTGACLVCLMGAPAYAIDSEQSCMDQLAQTETLVDQKVEATLLSESDVEEVNMLLDEADAACTEGDYKKASETLGNVNKLVSAAASPPSE
jgi:hypothetical protein